MRGATLFSGIGAPEIAAPEIEWVWHAEIDAFPSAVMAHHHGTPNLGDVSADDFIERAKQHGPIDILVAGSPCQSFSVAGKRLGLDDPRGNLALVTLGICRQLKPRWLVFENVPGLLTSGRGDDFAAFLDQMEKCGYAGGWRVLDAQYAGVAQRRRRVFVVGHLGDDWRPPAAVLFEPESLRWDTAPSRQAREETAGDAGSGAVGDGGPDARASEGDASGEEGWPAETSSTLNAAFGSKLGLENQHIDSGAPLFVPAQAPTLTKSPSSHSSPNVASGQGVVVGFDAYNQQETGEVSKTVAARNDQDTASLAVVHGTQDPITNETTAYALGRNHGQENAVFSIDENRNGHKEIFGTLQARREGGGFEGAVAFSSKDYGADAALEVSPTLRAGGHDASHANGGIPPAIASPTVRRLTPRECERLQGFPDDFTAITYRKKPAADGPRYKALGNSMAVPVIGWVLNRVQMFSELRPKALRAHAPTDQYDA